MNTQPPQLSATGRQNALTTQLRRILATTALLWIGQPRQTLPATEHRKAMPTRVRQSATGVDTLLPSH